MPTWTKEQNDAITLTGKNIIVSAGAGSGKTAVLSARVLNHLKNGMHVNELLILTFTKAAASEMKERIRKNISKEPSLIEELSLLDSSYITTFDAFSLSIVKKYHYLLNLPSSPKITDDSIVELLRKQIMRKTMDTFYELKDPEFLQFIRTFCVKNDDDIYSSLLNMSKKIENKLDYLTFLESKRETCQNSENNIKYYQEFEILVKEQIEEMKDNIEEFSLIAPKEYIAKLKNDLSLFLNANTYEELYTLKSVKLPSLPKNSEDEIKAAKENLNQQLKTIKAYFDYGSKEDILLSFQIMNKNVSVLIDILESYFKNFEDSKKQQNIFTFSSIARIATQIVEEFPKVKKELTNQFKEIMIDEYQDTNDIQESFIKLIAKDNIYMVGDIKQSIYRFRNANPYLFKDKYNQYKNHLLGEKIDLLKNFRSRKQVLNAINLMFNVLMKEEIGGCNYLEEHQMIFGNQLYETTGLTKENYDLEVLHYDLPLKSKFSKEEVEIFAIAQDIKEKVMQKYLLFDKDSEEIRPCTWNDFVILMDRTSSFNHYRRVFEYANIPVTTYQDEVLNETILFDIVRNLLILVSNYQTKNISNEFKFAFTSIARSFLFEETDEQILNIFEENNFFENRIYKTLKPIILELNYLSLETLLIKLYETTRIYENLIKIGNIKESEYVLERIIGLAKNYGDLGHDFESWILFLKDIQKEDQTIKYSSERKSQNSVKLMTIHKSKGLEFPVCYFSGLSKNFNIADIKENFLLDETYGFLTPLFEEGIRSHFLKELMKNNYKKEEISEKIRLFYVALTRAKEKIILILPNKTKEISNNPMKFHSLADMVHSMWTILESYQRKIDLDDLGLTKDYLFQQAKEYQDNSKKEEITVVELSKENGLEEKEHFSKKTFHLRSQDEQKNMELGLKVHQYFEYIDFKNPIYDLIDDKFVARKIEKFINSHFLQSHMNDNMFKEFEFIYQDEKTSYHGIIDLLIETEEEFIIVDYKLNNILDEAYIRQVNGYKNYLMKLKNKNVKMYLYSILDELIEEIK